MLAGLLLLGMLLGIVYLLLTAGLYGWMLFAVVPLLLGAIAAWWTQPRGAGAAAWAGVMANALGTGLLLALRKEGMICIVMACPLILPLGALGGVLAYNASQRMHGGGAAAMLAVLPIGAVGWDVTARPELFEVRSAIEVAATSEQVWKHVVTFSDLPEPTEWYFRTGLAYPKRAHILGSGPGAIRYCEFSTGAFVEPIEVWDEPHLLQFRVTQSPAPMHEWSPYADVTPKHLHGYLISKRGEFRLTPLGGNRTLLEGRTWYQHGLWPAEYWRWWSQAIIHRIHMRVLNHIKTLAESDASRRTQ